MGRSEVLTSVVKWSECLSNRMSIIIRRIFKFIYNFMIVMYVPFCVFCVLFVSRCVLYCCTVCV
jgi:hypothetical protein